MATTTNKTTETFVGVTDENNTTTLNKITTNKSVKNNKKLKDHLSVKEVMRITDDVLDVVINNDEGVYRPELFEYYFRMYVVEAFTGKEYDDLDKSYNDLFRIDNIYNQIVERVEDTGEITALRSAIKSKINYYVSKDLRKTKYDSLLESLSNLIDSSTGLATEETQNVIKKFSNMENLNLQSVINTVMEYINKPVVSTTDNVVNLPNKEV